MFTGLISSLGVVEAITKGSEYATDTNRDWLTKIKLNRPRIILKIQSP